MQLPEFIAHTGIYPDQILYEVIEREYCRRTEDGRDAWESKGEFCHAYKFNEGGLASRLQAAADEAIWRRDEAHRKAMTENSALVQRLYSEIEKLKKALDAELEWTPAADAGTSLEQRAYDEMASSPAVHVLSDEEAADKMSAFFGFIRERIEIVRSVNSFERDRHGRLRVRETFGRAPLYGASDMCYVRFNCAGLQWEMIGGELIPYVD